MPQRYRRWMPLVTAAIIAVAACLVWRVLRQFSLDDVLRSLHRLSAGRLALAALFTAGSYLSLTGFDYLGVRYAGARLPYRRVALASFTGLSIGHTLGLAPLSTGAIRYRFYSQWGLDAESIAKIVLFSAVTVGIGELSLSTIVLLAEPDLAGRVLGVDATTARLIGGAGAAALALYLGLAARVRGRLRIRSWSFELPDWRLALGQIVIGAIDFACVAAALHQTLSAAGPVDYASVATAFILANLAALMTHVPGGVGVEEAVVITLLPGTDAIGGLIAFRVIYFLVPLTIGTVLFGGVELTRRMRPRRKAERAAQHAS
ncbi:MAG: hypothetical protein JWL84_2740 [Rhodospirillales bacterium]|nr:hypothetical protein [Rhodospirillales bacterium]